MRLHVESGYKFTVAEGIRLPERPSAAAGPFHHLTLTLFFLTTAHPLTTSFLASIFTTSLATGDLQDFDALHLLGVWDCENLLGVWNSVSDFLCPGGGGSARTHPTRHWPGFIGIDVVLGDGDPLPQVLLLRHGGRCQQRHLESR